jgi:hypothetical protein
MHPRLRSGFPSRAIGLRAAKAVLAKTLPPATGGTDGFTHNSFSASKSLRARSIERRGFAATHRPRNRKVVDSKSPLFCFLPLPQSTGQPPRRIVITADPTPKDATGFELTRLHTTQDASQLRPGMRIRARGQIEAITFQTVILADASFELVP